MLVLGRVPYLPYLSSFAREVRAYCEHSSSLCAFKPFENDSSNWIISLKKWINKQNEKLSPSYTLGVRIIITWTSWCSRSRKIRFFWKVPKNRRSGAFSTLHQFNCFSTQGSPRIPPTICIKDNNWYHWIPAPSSWCLLIVSSLA